MTYINDLVTLVESKYCRGTDDMCKKDGKPHYCKSRFFTVSKGILRYM